MNRAKPESLVGIVINFRGSHLQIVKPLIAGITRVVYEGTIVLKDAETPTRVLVKFARDLEHPNAHKLILQESKTLESLSYLEEEANREQGLGLRVTPTYYGHGEYHEIPYLVTELIDGKRISELLSLGERKLPERQAVTAAWHLYRTLDILHRGLGKTFVDLKFEDLWWVDGQLKITDFEALEEIQNADGQWEGRRRDILRAATYFCKMATGYMPTYSLGELKEFGALNRLLEITDLSWGVKYELRKLLHRNPLRRPHDANDVAARLRTLTDFWSKDLNQVLEIARGDLERAEAVYEEINKNDRVAKEYGVSSAYRALSAFGIAQRRSPEVPFDFQNNPFSIPYEALRQNINVLEDYFAESKQPLNEVKIILVGQPNVGKTAIKNRLISNSYTEMKNKTDGVDIAQWEIALDNKTNIHINFWDFGGQEVMHSFHQFFLTKRSIYLLVLDACSSSDGNRIEYWLKIIESFGGDSPVLMLGNKIDQHPFDIDRTGIQKKYPNVIGIFETSAATGAGMEELKAAITEQIKNLPHVRELLPETWFAVKAKLEDLGHESNFITHDKYLELCLKNEVNDDGSQRTLIGFLHDLGVVLHFQDDARLEALGILNPQWVTNGVYKILNSHTLFQNKGVLTVVMLDEILNLPEYPRGKRLFIVDMMKKFELCYDIEPDKTFLVPDLLPKDELAELKFNGVPAFEYAYPVLPSSIITRFIVRMNQHICDGCVWRTGVLLQLGNNTALVKADIEDLKITIAIDGLEHTRRDALSAIRYQLDEIHASIKGLDPQKKVPVPNAPKAEPLKYEYLLKLERAGQESLLVENGNELITVNVRQMLSAIETESQSKESRGTVTNIYIGGNVEGSNIVSGNNNVVMQRIQESFNKAEGADIQAELKTTLKQLADAVAVMTKSLPAEKAAEATDDLSKLVDEATKPAPSKKWYSVSIDGLIKAAENLGKVGEPVINLSQKVLFLLTGGVVN